MILNTPDDLSFYFQHQCSWPHLSFPKAPQPNYGPLLTPGFTWTTGPLPDGSLPLTDGSGKHPQRKYWGFFKWVLQKCSSLFSCLVYLFSKIYRRGKSSQAFRLEERQESPPPWLWSDIPPGGPQKRDSKGYYWHLLFSSAQRSFLTLSCAPCLEPSRQHSYALKLILAGPKIMFLIWPMS